MKPATLAAAAFGLLALAVSADARAFTLDQRYADPQAGAALADPDDRRNSLRDDDPTPPGTRRFGNFYFGLGGGNGYNGDRDRQPSDQEQLLPGRRGYESPWSARGRGY